MIINSESQLIDLCETANSIIFQQKIRFGLIPPCSEIKIEGIVKFSPGDKCKRYFLDYRIFCIIFSSRQLRLSYIIFIHISIHIQLIYTYICPLLLIIRTHLHLKLRHHPSRSQSASLHSQKNDKNSLKNDSAE